MMTYTVDREIKINEDTTLYPGQEIELVETMVSTDISQKAGNTIMSYRGTNVVSFNDKNINLDPNGWWTKTTKRRMNQASEEYNLGYWVYQKRGQWYVDYKDKTIPFNDGPVMLDR